MSTNPPENTPRFTAVLLYEHVASALGWLTETFGFPERMRIPGPDGKIMRAEVELADGVVMMGRPGPDSKNPKRLGHVTQELYVYVDDVDKHFEHAKRAGTTRIVGNPGTTGGSTGVRFNPEVRAPLRLSSTIQHR